MMIILALKIMIKYKVSIYNKIKLNYKMKQMIAFVTKKKAINFIMHKLLKNTNSIIKLEIIKLDWIIIDKQN